MCTTFDLLYGRLGALLEMGDGRESARRVRRERAVRASRGVDVEDGENLGVKSFRLGYSRRHVRGALRIHAAVGGRLPHRPRDRCLAHDCAKLSLAHSSDRQDIALDIVRRAEKRNLQS